MRVLPYSQRRRPHALQYVVTLRSMLHAAPRDPFSSIAAVFAEEFPGRSLADAFERVDEEPIASASLAQVSRRGGERRGLQRGAQPRSSQVHVAYLNGSGRKVALKVRLLPTPLVTSPLVWDWTLAPAGPARWPRRNGPSGYLHDHRSRALGQGGLCLFRRHVDAAQPMSPRRPSSRNSTTSGSLMRSLRTSLSR